MNKSVILITGASAGIGNLTARALAQASADADPQAVADGMTRIADLLQPAVLA